MPFCLLEAGFRAHITPGLQARASPHQVAAVQCCQISIVFISALRIFVAINRLAHLL
jgi:hypothetical protein